jgi:hypothetical protein
MLVAPIFDLFVVAIEFLFSVLVVLAVLAVHYGFCELSALRVLNVAHSMLAIKTTVVMSALTASSIEVQFLQTLLTLGGWESEGKARRLARLQLSVSQSEKKSFYCRTTARIKNIIMQINLGAYQPLCRISQIRRRSWRSR